MREARAEGRVARSAVLTAACSVGATAGLVAFAAPWGWQVLRSFTGVVLHGAGMVRVPGDIAWLTQPAVAVFLVLVVPVAAMAAAGAALGGFLQVGPLWALGAVAPDSARLRPRGLDAPGLLVGSFLAAGLVLLGLDALVGAVPLAGAAWSPGTAASAIAGALGTLGARVLALSAVLGGLDFLWRRQRLRHTLRMTRSEWVRSQREDAGDPQVRRERSRLRRADLDVAQWGSLGEGELVFHGDGVAVVGRRRGEVVPRVLAVGLGMRGDHLLAQARAAGITPVFDPDVSGSCVLVGVGRSVPRSLFGAVAGYLMRPV